MKVLPRVTINRETSFPHGNQPPTPNVEVIHPISTYPENKLHLHLCYYFVLRAKGQKK